MTKSKCDQCGSRENLESLNDSIFCSRRCFLESKKDARKRYAARITLEAKLALGPRPCQHCGNIIPMSERRNVKYCGDECRREYAILNTRRYRESLTEEQRAASAAIVAQRVRQKRLAAGHPPCIDCGCHIATEIWLSVKRCPECKIKKKRADDREWTRKYTARHKEQVDAKNIRYRAANRDRVNEMCSQWRKRNPDLTRIQANRRRARKLNALTDDTVYNMEVYIRDGGQCYLCGYPVDWNAAPYSDESFNLEHVTPYDAGGLHHLDNVACSHQLCNLRKGTKLLTELNLPFDPPASLLRPSHTTGAMVEP